MECVAFDMNGSPCDIAAMLRDMTLSQLLIIQAASNKEVSWSQHELIASMAVLLDDWAKATSPDARRRSVPVLFDDWAKATSPDARRRSVACASHVCQFINKLLAKFHEEEEEEVRASGRNFFTELYMCVRHDKYGVRDIFLCRLTMDFMNLIRELEADRQIRPSEAVTQDLAIARAFYAEYQKSRFFTQPTNDAAPIANE